jgi:uncharacterized membrane protein YdbT with pleckstrin-like domain
MASYITQILIDGEQLIYQARLSIWSQASLVLIGIVLTPVFGVGLLLLLWAWIVCRTTELAITNKRIISKSGLVRRSIMELRLDKIESIKVDQSIVGRLLNFGSITIAGTGGDKTPIERIADPLQFQKHFMSAVDTLRKADR